MTKTKRKNIYPILILLLLGSFLLFSTWSAFQAAGLGSRVADADYYSKGLKYNTTLVEKRAASVLGWDLTTALNGRTLDFQLHTRDGSAVDRANGFLYLAIPDAAENVLLPLREVAAGHYQIELDPALRGTIQARIELERDGARLNRQLLLNL
jgi:nitrogen fixation protein FixH